METNGEEAASTCTIIPITAKEVTPASTLAWTTYMRIKKITVNFCSICYLIDSVLWQWVDMPLNQLISTIRSGKRSITCDTRNIFPGINMILNTTLTSCSLVICNWSGTSCIIQHSTNGGHKIGISSVDLLLIEIFTVYRRLNQSLAGRIGLKSPSTGSSFS